MPAAHQDPQESPDPAGGVLSAERAYLAAARADLAAMREATLALDARGGDAVSAAFLPADARDDQIAEAHAVWLAVALALWLRRLDESPIASAPLRRASAPAHV